MVVEDEGGAPAAGEPNSPESIEEPATEASGQIVSTEDDAHPGRSEYRCEPISRRDYGFGYD